MRFALHTILVISFVVIMITMIFCTTLESDEKVPHMSQLEHMPQLEGNKKITYAPILSIIEKEEEKEEKGIKIITPTNY